MHGPTTTDQARQRHLPQRLLLLPLLQPWIRHSWGQQALQQRPLTWRRGQWLLQSRPRHSEEAILGRSRLSRILTHPKPSSIRTRSAAAPVMPGPGTAPALRAAPRGGAVPPRPQLRLPAAGATDLSLAAKLDAHHLSVGAAARQRHRMATLQVPQPQEPLRQLGRQALRARLRPHPPHQEDQHERGLCRHRS